jgi:cytochrome c oxidase subunit 2
MPNFTLLAAAADSMVDVSTLNPASPPAESIRYLFIFVTALSAFILAIVWGVLFYSLLRFRRRAKRQESGAVGEMEPPQVYGSMPIEIAWTVGPALIVFLLTLVIVRTELAVRPDPRMSFSSANSMRATVIGHQWWWEYVIQEDGERKINVVTANELHVPVSGPRDANSTANAENPDQWRRINLTLQSADVCHSFWIPRLAGKTDLIPGRNENQTWFKTTESGLYLGQCAEYCGTQHANMLLRVYVDSEEDFQKWLANEAMPAVDDPSAREGKQAFLSQSCINCHTVRGTPAHGKFGPDLTHLASRSTIGAGMIPLDRDNLHAWITDPQQIKSGCTMPAFGLSEKNVNLITDFLMSLK